MQESRYDGSVILTDRATPEQLLAALGDPRNKTVAAHKPGSASCSGTWRPGPASGEA